MMTPEQAAWIFSYDAGMSSKTIYAVMIGAENPNPRTPLDPADLGRCLRLLDLFPEWRPRLGEVAEKYPEWDLLIREWHNLAVLYYEELPSGLAPKCYDAMRACRAEALA